jgi:hypothetical protein
MKKVLIAVDDTKGTKNAFTMCSDIMSHMRPETIVLVYVEKFEGRSLIDEMLGNAEMSTLKEVLEGTEYKEALDIYLRVLQLSSEEAIQPRRYSRQQKKREWI